MADQRAAKGAISQKIHVLFKPHQVAGQLLQRRPSVGRKLGWVGLEPGLAQVLQVLGRESIGEVLEVHREIDVLQMLVEQIEVRLGADQFGLLAEHAA